MPNMRVKICNTNIFENLFFNHLIRFSTCIGQNWGSPHNVAGYKRPSENLLIIIVRHIFSK